MAVFYNDRRVNGVTIRKSFGPSDHFEHFDNDTDILARYCQIIWLQDRVSAFPYLIYHTFKAMDQAISLSDLTKRSHQNGHQKDEGERAETGTGKAGVMHRWKEKRPGAVS